MSTLEGFLTHSSPSVLFPHLQAFRKFDELATQHTEKLRKLTKQVQEHRQSHDDDAVKRVVEEYDETLEWCVFSFLYYSLVSEITNT